MFGRYLCVLGKKAWSLADRKIKLCKLNTWCEWETCTSPNAQLYCKLVL